MAKQSPAKAYVTIVVERDAARSGSGLPGLGHFAYRLKKLIERSGLKGSPRVVSVSERQDF